MLKDGLYLGDCLELLKDIKSKSVDMCLTDIPYGEVNRNSNGLILKYLEILKKV